MKNSQDWRRRYGAKSMPSVIITSVIVGLTSIRLAIADPSPVIRKLMHDPVSMLDLGLYRMSQYLQASFEAAGQAGDSPSAFYDWGANRIIVAASLIGGVPRIDAQKTCDERINEVRRDFYVVNGDVPTDLVAWEGFFEHHGFATKDSPNEKALIEELPKLVHLRIWIFGTGWRARCEAPLLGRHNISFSME